VPKLGPLYNICNIMFLNDKNERNTFHAEDIPSEPKFVHRLNCCVQLNSLGLLLQIKAVLVFIESQSS
jgi:hypothetical protein